MNGRIVEINTKRLVCQLAPLKDLNNHIPIGVFKRPAWSTSVRHVRKERPKPLLLNHCASNCCPVTPLLSGPSR